MTYFVESLRRLYTANKITKTKLDEYLISKKINQQEYEYITSAEML